jgi:hypothetical protein
MGNFGYHRLRRAPLQFSGTVPYLIAGSAASLLYIQGTADPGALRAAGLALVLQILTWTLAMALLAKRSGNFIRISDPGVLVLAMAALYLIYPSVVWTKTQTLAGVSITHETASLLFHLHSLYIIAFTAGYICIAPRWRDQLTLDLRHLPSGRSWLLIPAGILFVSIAIRLAGGGGVFPTTNYASNWYDLQAGILASRSRGGLGYILTQINSKTSFYSLVIQGVAGGLMLTRAIALHKRTYRTLFLLAALAAAVVLFGDGGRGPGVIIMIITLVFADLAIGPIPLKLVAPVILAGMFGFMLLGYYRTVRDLGVVEAARVSYQRFGEHTESDNAGEFTSMLPKEALVLELFEGAPKEGFQYLWTNVLMLVPSQLVPQKLQWSSTAAVLSRRMLGPSAAAMGAGAAGTTIGDGYKFAGVAGVPILACLLGAIMGTVHRWLFGRKAHGSNLTFLKAILVSGFYGFAFKILRDELGATFVYAFYGIVVPYFFLTFVIRCPRAWIAPSRERGRSVMAPGISARLAGRA